MHYSWDASPKTIVSAAGQEHLKDILESEYAVFVGRNNCGKSFLLKTLTEQLGQRASYLGPGRYNNFNVLGNYTPNRNRINQRWKHFIDQWRRRTQNHDNSPLNLQQAIAELNDDQRDVVSDITEILLGTRLDIRYTVPNNSMSQKYIDCQGHNISFTSSGFRLITTLITCLLDTEYDTFLIDEPGLGISPEAQGTLADFLFDRKHRKTYFPHIKTLIMATHSTVFLDRRYIGNNYSVTKTDDAIDISKTGSIAEFNNIHFFLLGNRLESLYLPACIVLTEGKTDHAYLSRVLETKFPSIQFSVVNAGSDSRMKEIVSLTGSLLTDLQKSPYRTRIIPVLDKTHGADILDMFRNSGIPDDNIVVWDQNGIEFYYPDSIIDKIFGVGSPIAIRGDVVSRNDIKYKKNELCEKVVAQISSSTTYPSEFESKFLGSVARACDAP